MTYTPATQILDRYAHVLINYGLGFGVGIRPGDVVQISAPEDARPLYSALHRAVLLAGGHPLGIYLPASDRHHSELRILLEVGSDEQLDFLAEKYWRGVVEQVDHLVRVDCERDPHALEGVDTARLMRRRRAMAPVSRWRDARENRGEYSWLVCVYGTDGMAAEAGLTLEQYWQQIVAACQLEDPDPLSRWRQIDAELRRYARWLTEMPIDRVHVHGPDVDLRLTIGASRRWIGGEGANIPTFEVFTSPDWRGTEGWIRFDQPLYAFGTVIEGIELAFEAGVVVRARASRNERLLHDLLGVENGDRVGELSLTDSRLSPITHFMANTLYDENMGGPYGNTHLALGDAYFDTYTGDRTAITDEQRDALGFNDCATHTDIVSTTDRTVTATLRDGVERVIYRNGRFTL